MSAERSAELVQVDRPTTALIDPMLIWSAEEEDEFGNALAGIVLEDLREVHYGGHRWVTTCFVPQIMLRLDVVGYVDTRPWAPHEPDQMWYAHARPVAERVEQKFSEHHIASLRAIGAKVLPLVPGSVPSPTGAIHGHLVHAVMRGEDWIGFVMARAKGGGSMLPEDLMVPLPPGSVTP